MGTGAANGDDLMRSTRYSLCTVGSWYRGYLLITVAIRHSSKNQNQNNFHDDDFTYYDRIMPQYEQLTEGFLHSRLNKASLE